MLKKNITPEKIKREIRSFIVILFFALIIRSFLFQPFIIPSGSMKPNLWIGDFILVSKYHYGFTKYSLPFNFPIIPKRILAFNKPKIGDVIVFKGPYDPEIDYIKRVVGLPGDKVQMREGILYINDQESKIKFTKNFIDDYWIKREGARGKIETAMRAKKDYRNIPMFEETLPNGVSHYMLKKYPHGTNGTFDNSKVYIVPERHYFVMGDNRDESGDSRVQQQIGFVPQDNITGKALFVWLSVRSKLLEFWRWWDIRISRILTKIS